MGDKKPLCKLGQQIEIQLVKSNKTNAWLINEVATDTGLYFDRSYLHKVKTGEVSTPKIVTSLCKILSLPQPAPQEEEF